MTQDAATPARARPAERAEPAEPRPAGRDDPGAAQAARVRDMLILGAGFAGMAMAIEARKAGIGDVLILEKADDFGGTWRENTYPGVACDVPSHLYCLASHPKPDWSRTYASGAEIWAYQRDVARRERLADVTRFGVEATAAAWDDEAKLWRVETAGGETFAARFLVSAMGPLHVPKLPDIEGLEAFGGPVVHSARWDHGLDLSGKRVAVIGAGASAVQFTPEVAKIAAHVDVYQRTAPWVLPRLDGPTPEFWKKVYARFSPALRVRRAAVMAWQEMNHRAFRGDRRAVKLAQAWSLSRMRKAVRDPALRRKLTPSHRIGCKRILLSNDWYETLARPDVEVVAERIARIAPGAVVAADGVARPADAILLGTGFQVTEAPLAMPIRGAGGRLLADRWRDGMEAYLGAATTGFPNLFFLLGPNTGLGHNSVLLMAEAQIAHALRVIRAARRKGWAALEPRPEVHDRFVREVRGRLAGMVWQTGGCTSWYQDAAGRNTTLWPGTAREFRRRTAAAGLGEYREI